MRGGFSRYIGQGPGEPRTDPWISEGPIAIAIDVLFWFFHFLGVFSTLLKDVSVCPRPTSSFVPPWKLSLGDPGVRDHRKTLRGGSKSSHNISRRNYFSFVEAGLFQPISYKMLWNFKRHPQQLLLLFFGRSPYRVLDCVGIILKVKLFFLSMCDVKVFLTFGADLTTDLIKWFILYWQFKSNRTS